jgi:hypothetical protein
MDRNDQFPVSVALLQIKDAEWTLGDDLDFNIGIVFSKASRDKCYKYSCKHELRCGSEEW